MSHVKTVLRPLTRREKLLSGLLLVICIAGMTVPRPALAAGVGKIIALINQRHGAPLSGTAPTNDYVMTYDSATGQWGPEAASAAAQSAALLDGSEHTDTTAGTVARGDVVTGQGATAKWTRLAKGTAGYRLEMGAEEPQWAAPGHTTANVVDTLSATLGAGADANDVAITNGGGYALNDDAAFRFGSAAGDMQRVGETVTLGAETAVEVCSLVMADGDFAGVTITYSIVAYDAADDASVETGTVQVAIIDMAGGGVTASTPGVVSVIEDVGACVLTQGVWSVTTTDDQSIEINVASVVAGITQTTHEIVVVVTYTGNVSVTFP